MGYDTKCDELVRYFLSAHTQDEDYEVQVADLAEAIQGRIEDWFAERYPLD